MLFFNKQEKHTQASSGLSEQQQSCLAELQAIKQCTAYIAFTPDGMILDANELLLSCMGYQYGDIVGKHHRMFCPQIYTSSPEYKAFWQTLASGKSVSGTFLRVRKDGQAVYLQASYFPVLRADGSVEKVVKLASDVTSMHQRMQTKEAIYEAIDKSMAVIEFLPDGTVLTANANFLHTMGYRLEQIAGKHHRMFCSDEFYQKHPSFWRELAAGEFKTGRFERLNAHRETVWLEASYNPIYDADGHVFKVIKFASDITKRVNSAMEAIHLAAATSEQTSQIANNAVAVLHEAVETSHHIADQVKRASALGNQLMDQSKNINDIVVTIRGIADQTNLLALNAAIEAARAGDAGRGFAVVADEVRKLAARTAEATTEIANVVQNNTGLIRNIDDELGAITGTALHGEESINNVANGLQDVSIGVSRFVDMVERLKT